MHDKSAVGEHPHDKNSIMVTTCHDENRSGTKYTFAIPRGLFPHYQTGVSDPDPTSSDSTDAEDSDVVMVQEDTAPSPKGAPAQAVTVKTEPDQSTKQPDKKRKRRDSNSSSQSNQSNRSEYWKKINPGSSYHKRLQKRPRMTKFGAMINSTEHKWRTCLNMWEGIAHNADDNPETWIENLITGIPTKAFSSKADYLIPCLHEVLFAFEMKHMVKLNDRTLARIKRPFIPTTDKQRKRQVHFDELFVKGSWASVRPNGSIILDVSTGALVPKNLQTTLSQANR